MDPDEAERLCDALTEPASKDPSKDPHAEVSRFRLRTPMSTQR
jgi:hypothetical protein